MNSQTLAKQGRIKKTPMVAAVIGNTLVVVAKFLGFLFTGSSALLSESIHSLADVLNQLLLLIGVARAQRKPDSTFQYGYGSERFIWALISAVGIFFLGCGLTLYHGIFSLIHPKPVSDLSWAITILVISFVLEGVVFLIALRSLRKTAAGKPFWRYVREEAEPGVVAVLFEDAIACLGVILALISIGLTQWTGQLFWDSVGSILIGILMGFFAVFLVVRNHLALVGPSIPDSVRRRVVEIIRRHPTVDKIVDMRSSVIDGETYRIKADIKFNGRVFAGMLEKKIRHDFERIKTFEDFNSFAIEYADSVLELLGDEIDTIESEIQKAIPQAQFLDFEAD